MKTAKTSSLQIPVSAEKRALYETRAKELGMKVTEFSREALDAWANMEAEFHQTFSSRASKMGISESTFLETIAIAWLARKAAQQQAWQAPTSILDEFIPTDEGFLTGRALYDELFTRYLKEESRDYETEIAKHPGLASMIKRNQKE